MATQAERITALEVHYEHVDKTLTAMSATLDAFRAEVADRFDRIDEKFERIDEKFGRIDEKFERIQKAIADDRVERSETKLQVALRVTSWLVGIVTAVLGAVVGGLFVFARFLIPKLGQLASLGQDAAPLVG